MPNRHSPLALLLLAACSGAAETNPESTWGGPGTLDDGGSDGADGGSDTGAGEAPLAEDLPNGAFLLNFTIASVGGLVIPFQATIETRAPQGADRVISVFELRATDGADGLSELLAETTADTAVGSDGSYALTIPNFTLPGEYSPTGSDVEVQAVLSGTFTETSGFCGTVTGQIVTFELDLAGSTFGAVPWEERASGGLDACDGGSTEPLPRLTASECPVLGGGVTTGFASGGELRDLEIVLPAAYDAAVAWPVIFVWHWFGGSPSSMLDEAGLRAWADEAGYILVAAQAQDIGGATAWDVFGEPDRNVDITLFDDLLTCTTASFNVDPNRIYATGMSAGGLFTSTLIANRASAFAAAAPFSGGLMTEYTPGGAEIPVQVTWGGETDEAFDQDFDALTLAMIETLSADGHFLVTCNHGLGHEMLSEFWPWTIQFFQDHPLDIASEPYAAGLPDVYPDYCSPVSPAD